MKIDEAHLNRRVKLAQNLIRLAKRAISGRHVRAALQIDHSARDILPRAGYQDAAARIFVRVVSRAQKLRLARQIVQDFLLVPDMIPGSKYIQTQSEQFLGDRRRDTETAGCIFSIGDGQIDMVGLLDVLQMVGDDVTPRRGEDIADEEDVHS
jgi:hypothetical protein